jgi:tetratricopeptide (TPR) repeat protein
LLKINPDHAEAHLRLGHVLKLENRHKDAIDEIEWCLNRTHEPNLVAVAHLLIGDIHRAHKELSQAAENYRAALAIDPLCQPTATALSYCLDRAGDRNGARDVLQRFFENSDQQMFSHDSWWRYLRGDREKLLEVMGRMRGDLR